MANPFRNAIAGGLDLLATPVDVLGIGAGALTGTYSFLTGDGFWNGFVDNPFTRFQQNVHEGITDLTGADEDSLLRDLVGAADVIVGTGIAKDTAKHMTKRMVAKQLLKKSNKASKELGQKVLKKNWIGPTLKKNLSYDKIMENFGDYALGQAAFGMLTPGESKNDRFYQGAAALTLGHRGLKKLKNFKTKGDLYQQSPEKEFAQKTEKFIAKDKANDRRVSWFDAQGGSVDKWLQNGTIGHEMAINLKKTATDKANAMPEMQQLADIIKARQSIDTKLYDKWNRFGGLNATMGARVGGLRRLINDMIAKGGNLAGLGFANVEEAKQFLTQLDAQKDIVDMFEMSRKYLDNVPEYKGLGGMPNQNLIDEFKVLQKDLGETHFMNAQMKSLDKQILDMYLDAGMIGTNDYNRLLKDVNSGLYVPTKSDNPRDLRQIYKSSNPMENSRRDLADVGLNETFQGVDDTGNILNVYANKIKSELEAYQRQLTIRENLPRLQEAVNGRINSLDDSINELKKYGENHAAEALANYKKDFGKVYLDAFNDNDVKKLAKEKKILPKFALERLEKKYAKEGLYRLESYTKVKTKNGFDSVKTYSYVPKSFQYIFEQRAVNASTFNKVIAMTNRMFTSTISGKWNPFFLAKRLWYGVNEIAPALRTELAQQGINVGTWDVMKLYWSSLEDSLRHNWNQTMIDAMDDGTFLGKMANGDRMKYAAKLDDISGKIADYNISRNDVMGETMKNAVNAIDISFNKTPKNVMMQRAQQVYNWVDKSSLSRVLDMLKNTIDDATPRLILKSIDEYGLEGKPILKNGKVMAESGADRQIVLDIVKKMSDTRRRGAGDTMLGKFFNAIQDYMPYGATSLQGLVGKFEYLPKDLVTNSKYYLEKAYKANNGSLVNTGLDVMAKVGQKMANLPDNMVFDTLWKMVAIPATICYIWNYGNEDNARYYNSLQPYERSNKLQLVNFFGNGINLSVPMDQEWSIIKNVYDAMLERMFGLSDAYDSGNPAFSMRDQLIWSLGQDFGIALPVAGEAALNLAGYKTNLDMGAALSGELPIQEINKHRFHTLDDGLATAMMQMTGKLGKMLVNMAEDKPVMDYRYAIPFVQINPRKKVTSDTVSYLNQQLKLNPTEELRKWARQRQRIKNDMNFYDRNGCTKDGRVLGSRKEVMRMYQRQLDDITRQVYYSIQESAYQVQGPVGQTQSVNDGMSPGMQESSEQLANQ